MIVDAVGVTETELVDTPPLDRQPTVPLEKLLRRLSFGVRDPRRGLVDRRAPRPPRPAARPGRPRASSRMLAGGHDLKEIARGIVAALDPDRQLEPRTRRRRDEPSSRRSPRRAKRCSTRPSRRSRRTPSCASGSSRCAAPTSRRSTRPRRTRCIEAGYSKDATDRARATVESWERFIEENRDEITALQILYAAPHAAAADVRRGEGAGRRRSSRPPHRWTPEKLWEAYEALDRSKVRGSGQRVLTDLVSLVRFALHQETSSSRTPSSCASATDAWLLQQENAGRDVHAPSSSRGSSGSATTSPRRSAITPDDFGYTPFVERGGLGKGGAGVRRRASARCSTS